MTHLLLRFGPHALNCVTTDNQRRLVRTPRARFVSRRHNTIITRAVIEFRAGRVPKHGASGIRLARSKGSQIVYFCVEIFHSTTCVAVFVLINRLSVAADYLFVGCRSRLVCLVRVSDTPPPTHPIIHIHTRYVYGFQQVVLL